MADFQDGDGSGRPALRIAESAGELPRLVFTPSGTPGAPGVPMASGIHLGDYIPQKNALMDNTQMMMSRPFIDSGTELLLQMRRHFDPGGGDRGFATSESFFTQTQAGRFDSGNGQQPSNFAPNSQQPQGDHGFGGSGSGGGSSGSHSSGGSDAAGFPGPQIGESELMKHIHKRREPFFFRFMQGTWAFMVFLVMAPFYFVVNVFTDPYTYSARMPRNAGKWTKSWWKVW